MYVGQKVSENPECTGNTFGALFDQAINNLMEENSEIFTSGVTRMRLVTNGEPEFVSLFLFLEVSLVHCELLVQFSN